MRNIADVLGVSVGYLIGETDYESFEMERVSKCIGLSESALIGIRNITSGKVIPPFYKYGDPQITAALENLLLTPQIVDYLKGLCELAEAMNRDQNPTDVFERTTKKYPNHIVMMRLRYGLMRKKLSKKELNQLQSCGLLQICWTMLLVKTCISRI